MKFRHLASASLAAATIALAACGGGGHSLPTAPGGSKTSHAGPTNATLSVFIPSATTTSSSKRRPAFISPSTKGIQVAVFSSPYHTGAVAVSSGSFDVSSASPNCSPAVSGGGSTCTFSIAVVPGTDDFIVTTYDLAPVNNVIPASAQRLGFGMLTNQAIASGQANTINIALGGVVAKVSLSLPTTATSNWSCATPGPAPSVPACNLLHAASLTTETGTVTAYDAKGNAIVSDGWYDVNGNVVTATVNADTWANPNTAAPAIGFNTPGPSPAPSATPAPLGSPAASVTVGYPGQFIMTFDPSKLLYAQLEYGFNNAANGNANQTTTLTASTSNSATTGTATVALLPPLIETPLASPSPGSASPTYLRISPKDGKLWFTAGNASIGSFDPATLTEGPLSYASGGANAQVQQLLPLSDGSVAFAEAGGTGVPGKIATLAASGPPVTEAAVPTPAPGTPTASPQPKALAQAADGSFWFTESQNPNKLVRYKPNAVAPASPFTEYTPSPTAPSTTAFTATNIGPNDMVAAPDGKSIWIAEGRANTPTTTQGYIDQIDVSTNLGQQMGPYAIPTLSSGAYAITIDRATGLVWILESSYPGKIASYDPVQKVWTEYPTPSGKLQSTGSSSQIVVAPDHSVWVTETGRFAHFIPGSSVATSSLTEFAGPSGSIGGIVAPSDGTIWFTEAGKNSLAHFFP